jgi:hypothetical protein
LKINSILFLSYYRNELFLFTNDDNYRKYINYNVESNYHYEGIFDITDLVCICANSRKEKLIEEYN